MSTIGSIETYTNGQVLTHTSLNTAFSTIRDTVNSYGMFTDVVRSITAVQTFSVAPVFSAGYSVTGTITMATAASKIVPGATSFSHRNNADNADNLLLTDAGAATFRSTVGGITTLSCTTVTATSLGGTITTAAQASITSLGTLTALTIAGDLTFSGASRKLIPGSTGLIIRNVGDTANAITVSANGVSIGTSALDIQLSQTLATNATAGFVLLPSCSGVPTGAVSDTSIILDTTNSRIYARIGGSWKSVTLA